MSDGLIKLDSEGIQILDAKKNVFIPWFNVSQIRAYENNGEMCISFKAGEWHDETRSSYSGFESLDNAAFYLPELDGIINRLETLRKLFQPNKDIILYERDA